MLFSKTEIDNTSLQRGFFGVSIRAQGYCQHSGYRHHPTSTLTQVYNMLQQHRAPLEQFDER